MSGLSKLKDIKPTTAWAEVSEDVPPEIWRVHWYKDQLRADLRKIRVNVIPIRRKRAKAK
jgi:hypothetical protein